MISLLNINKKFLLISIIRLRQKVSRRHRVPNVTIKDDTCIMKGYVFKKHLCLVVVSLKTVDSQPGVIFPRMRHLLVAEDIFVVTAGKTVLLTSSG